MSTTGKKDSKSVDALEIVHEPLGIQGATVCELRNVLTKSGSLIEVFRDEWESDDFVVRQVNWVELNPNGVTDWHRHQKQIDHLIAVGGNIKLALCDGRPDSPTQGNTEIIRMGAKRPLLVIVPPGVWHALRNESGIPAGYLNVFDERYDHDDPDNFRLASDASEIPDIL